MKKIIRITKSTIVVSIAFFILSTSLFAQESQSDALKKAEDEMKAALGTVPVMFRVYPENLRASAWEWFKAIQSPDGAVPSKYSQLIALGVASQIPCDYCVYAHTTMAKMFGATDAEIQAAVVSAANTRHWSTVLNGANVPFDEYKKEWDGILEEMKKQNKTK